MTLLVVLGVFALAVAWLVATYNRLVSLRNASESAFSDIDVQLRRRWELVPNLVETVKGYAQHEEGTLSRVIQARGSAMEASGREARGAAEGELTRVLKSLVAVAEAYPDLEANEGFLGLQRELAELEEAIQSARRYYNALVRDLNTGCETFPSNLVAQGFGIEREDYFEIDAPEERTAPRVRFGS